MNRKGFTLIELLATVTILGIIVTIGGVTISGIMNNAREKEYNLLITNIKSAAEVYYNDVVYGGASGSLSLTLGDLLDKGYILGNGEKCNEVGGKKVCTKTLVNPKEKDKPDITGCRVSLSYVTTGIAITKLSYESYCPTYY